MPLGPRYVVRISPDDVGRRVSLRVRRPEARQGEPGHTDVLGELRRWDHGELEIARRDGSVAVVAEDDVVAGRTVPPPPPKRR
ncbi:hypothetical protein ER308_17465 [Egibacter rhizosphaerae]|uniref:Histone acetyltransferase Rv0428c-like SH3 domain-containing protein n=1 Tax=Egibacter rhizosphaerae TaxID=1670831 RepID=A0A411YJ53_9ACTN|nr:hypothetical protein [Egibacter rhizosphaerae]QBI21181.1 hypothetical protein ER308_17465 [Egibacter rhizosphaerae]